MAKKRGIIIFSSFLIVFLILFISSSFFKLSFVEIVFYDSKLNKQTDISLNQVYKTPEKLNDLKVLATEDFGQSLFLLKPQKYYKKFEAQNPYAKLIDIKSKYPNKLVFYVAERKPCYIICSNNVYFILDSEYKIIEIKDAAYSQDLIEISCLTNEKKINYFEFFNISQNAFVEGQFLSENNLLLQSIVNIKDIIENTSFIFKNIKSIVFSDDAKSGPDLLVNTYCEYGAQFKIKNILNDFDKKLSVLLSEFEKSLEQNEKIKICFGCYEVGDDLKAIWNNL